MRILGLLLFITVISAAAFVYNVKYRTSRLAREAAHLENSIRNEENAITALRAEWSALNQPSRLQALAKRHLPEFQNLSVPQMAFAYELPDRAADLGKFINNLDEQKGLETPIDKKAVKVKTVPAPQANAPMKLIPIPLR